MQPTFQENSKKVKRKNASVQTVFIFLFYKDIKPTEQCLKLKEFFLSIYN